MYFLHMYFYKNELTRHAIASRTGISMYTNNSIQIIVYK